VDYYLIVGYVAQGAHVGVAARTPSGGAWDFSSLLTNYYTMSSIDIQKAVKNIENAPLHQKYDQDAPIQEGQRYFVGDDWFGIKNFQINHGLGVGGGVAFRITDRYNIGIEQKWVITGNDNLDGIVSGESADIESYTQVRLNINIGNSATHTVPLWWLNGNNYIYNEVNAPKHMKMPPVVLPDADGDGVTDQFDLEPNTPKGCPVDTHGVSLDTDGDGVPDCRDKEKLTPQSCFPVDADGVGKCPEPPCCDSLSKAIAGGIGTKTTCAIGSLPSITFKGSSLTVSKSAEALLASAAAQINANPGCKVKVIGYGVSTKAAQQLSWDRVNAVINYLVTKQGISENRFIFTYGQSGDANTVDLQGTTEEGPNTVPAPHPNLEKRK
jgi:outer membrane protein OmpA-like peptidoglycan-associated protein